MKVDLRLSAGIFPEKDRLSKNGRDTDGTSLQGGTATVEYIVSAEEMQRADENTINYFGIPQLVLMERAALTAKELMERRWQGILGEGARVLIACGNGNNGGDGAALARLLFLAGCDVTVLVSGEPEKYSSALRKQMEILERYCADKRSKSRDDASNITMITDDDWKQERERERIRKAERKTGAEKDGCLRGYDLVVDALFGIGLSRPIGGIYREKIEWLNRLGGKKAALDIPSGISARDGSVLGSAFRADLTVTFGFWKRGMLLYPGRDICGETIVADIGITRESFLGTCPAGGTIGRADRAKKRIKDSVYLGTIIKRSQNSHKGTYGKVLLFAGSAGAPGAALLAGEAVLRSGAGMLRMVSPAENRELVISGLPEAMYQALNEETDWEKLLGWCDAVVAGPGIGRCDLAERSLEKILTVMSETGARKPIVLDADGLNLLAFSERLSELVKGYAGQGGIVMMTPHMAEFARLLHCSVQDLQKERMERLEEYCHKMGAILVSKDAATVVGYGGDCQNFRYYINQTGNSGMATAGSGDVLSGIMGALAAFTAVSLREHGEEADRGAAYFQAAYHAVYLHGLAGDAAAEKYGEASMKAGDIIRALPKLLG